MAIFTRFLILSLFAASFMVESATGELNLRRGAPTMHDRKLKKDKAGKGTKSPKVSNAPKTPKATKAPKV